MYVGKNDRVVEVEFDFKKPASRVSVKYYMFLYFYFKILF